MNDSTIAFRAKEQLGKFLGKVFTHFSRPKQKFLADMLYGIQASGDTQLSSIMRAINDDPAMRHAVEKRLSRNVADEDIGDEAVQTKDLLVFEDVCYVWKWNDEEKTWGKAYVSPNCDGNIDEAIDEVTIKPSNSQTVKRLIDGQLYIELNGKVYNILGQPVK